MLESKQADVLTTTITHTTAIRSGGYPLRQIFSSWSWFGVGPLDPWPATPWC